MLVRVVRFHKDQSERRLHQTSVTLAGFLQGHEVLARDKKNRSSGKGALELGVGDIVSEDEKL